MALNIDAFTTLSSIFFYYKQFENTIYIAKITTTVVVDAFVHMISTDIQSSAKETTRYDMYNLFPHDRLTFLILIMNTEYLMLFRSLEISFFLPLFS